MTDYEYADLFASFLSAQNAVFANYMTIVSAMFAASWFVAAKLSRLSAVLLIFIYSLWAANLIGGIVAVFGDFTRLGEHIARHSQSADSMLGWLGPVAVSTAGMRWMYGIVILGSILAYLASLAFFFQVRRERIG